VVIASTAMTREVGARCASRRKQYAPSSRSPSVADLVFVVITVVLFAALAVLIRAVERW
jgi:hypothetical protein